MKKKGRLGGGFRNVNKADFKILFKKMSRLPWYLGDSGLGALVTVG